MSLQRGRDDAKTHGEESQSVYTVLFGLDTLVQSYLVGSAIRVDFEDAKGHLLKAFNSHTDWTMGKRKDYDKN